MSGILAIETSSDACSIAILRDGALRERHVVEPRRHNQLIFALLRELVEPHELVPAHFSAIAYGAGPGSFTGLRIAASAVQGLCFASGIPAIGVSTLAAIAQRALREGRVSEGDSVLAFLDARIGEMYMGLYRFEKGVAVLEDGPWATRPESLTLPSSLPVHLVGDSGAVVESLVDGLRDQILSISVDVMPMARDIALLAQAAMFEQGTQLPHEVQPVYVREEISWKKLSEQGKPV